jgi:uncharacterized damage-inducible protein DinB
MTPTGTNLLGLIKHLTGVELGYLGESVGRPSPIRPPWLQGEPADENVDMWATADESRAYLTELYQAACQHSDESITQLGLDAPAHVAPWPEDRRTTTLGRLVVHVLKDTAQHAGHADILRELIDGRAGRDQDQLGDDAWKRHVEQVRQAAESHLPT